MILVHAVVGPGNAVGHGTLFSAGASLDEESLLEIIASLEPGVCSPRNAPIGKRTIVGIQAGSILSIWVGQDSVLRAHSRGEQFGEIDIAYRTPARHQQTCLKKTYD